MGRKKLNAKVRLLIERCILTNERSLFFILGEVSQNQIVILHHVLLKARSLLKLPKPSILWCFKKDNGFSFACNKTQKILKKKYSKNYSFCKEDCFSHFTASTSIQFCHYSNTTSVLGQTFGMLVIQDFEAVTPNILARIIECIEGGGLIAIMMSSVQTLQEVTSLKMDAHSKYITFANFNIDPVFNSRFLLSLSDCENCIVMDDSLKVLSCRADSDTPHIGVKKKAENNFHNDSADVFDRISSLCCTADQSSALQVFIETLKKKTAKSVISLISARGRGKSATLGLAISSAVLLQYSRIFVTSPQVENIQTFYKFVIKGMEALHYKRGNDYSIVCNEENKELTSGVNIFHDKKQIVTFLYPTDFHRVGTSDVIVIDEAASIPLPLVKKWLKSDLVFMASTVNGYEGTGRSLSLKLINQLRVQSEQNCDFTLQELTLNEAIRYADGDGVEAWLNKLFCLDTKVGNLTGAAPNPEECQLYLVNKKVLFSYQGVAEMFLQQLMALFVSSHYKNSPNDLLMMADAPSHQLFCLLPPVDKKANSLPNILCAIQVSLEGKISKECASQELSAGKRAAGDLIPWIVSQQFQDDNFPILAGARVVRIATHPDVQRMGYGKQALSLLISYYQKSFTKLLKTDFLNRNSTLLFSLDELEPNELDYVGVSFGLTLDLLKFWKKLDFVPLYLRQTASETTGEHSCIMIKSLRDTDSVCLSTYMHDFLERFVTLLTSAFKNLSTFIALEILHYKRRNHSKVQSHFTDVNVNAIFTACSIKRLEAYCNHLVDYHLIMDLIPVLARCYFLNYFQNNFLSSLQEALLLSMGLQNKPAEEVAQELNMETSQLMGVFMKLVKKMLCYLVDLEKRFK